MAWTGRVMRGRLSGWVWDAPDSPDHYPSVRPGSNRLLLLALRLGRHLGALLPRVGETDRDRLFATLDRFARAAALELAVLPLVHGALDARLRLLAVLASHHDSPCDRSTTSG